MGAGGPAGGAVSEYEDHADVPPALPPRSRGVIGLLEENCTSCMLCARECPDWCIHIESHTEVVPAGSGGGRDRTRPVLDRFAIDFSLCMYCGICIEVCPFDALFWSPEFEYAEPDLRDLLHERDRLREWMWTVPPPPALDPAGEPPKEQTGGRAERPGRAAPGRPRRTGPVAGARAGGRPEAPAPGGGPQPGDTAARPVEPDVARAAEAGAPGPAGEREPRAPR